MNRDAICACVVAGDRNMILHPLMASRSHHVNAGRELMGGHHHPYASGLMHNFLSNGQAPNHSGGGGGGGGNGGGGSSASTRRDHNIDYSALFVQLSGTFPTLYRCVSCHKTVSNRWHHANIHRPQKHECPVCHQVFTRRDNMKAHCKVKHADKKDIFYRHLVHM